MALGDGPTSPVYTLATAIDPTTGQGVPTSGGRDTVYPTSGNATLNARNTAPTLVAPAGSALEVDTNGRASASFQISANTLNQALSLYGTIDGTNWVSISGTPLLNQSTGVLSATIPAAATGIFTASVADFAKVRLSTPDIALTGSATVKASVGTPVSVVAVDNMVNIAAVETAAVFTQERRTGTAGTPAAVVLAASTNTQILPANTARRGAMIVNRSGQTVYLRFGATAASASLYSWELATGEKYEVPFGITAAIQAISVLAGAAIAPGIGLFVTEFTN